MLLAGMGAALPLLLAWTMASPAAQQPRWEVVTLAQPSGLVYRLEYGRHSRPLPFPVPDSLYPSSYERWELAHETDLDGDAVPEAIVLYFTGGAHCCFEYLIAASTPNGIVVQDWFSLGNSQLHDVRDLDGDGIPELLANDDRFAYFPDLSYADTPALPLVLCRSATGQYYDCTARRFPEMLRNSAREYAQALAAVSQAATVPSAYDRTRRDLYSRALGLLGSYLRLGSPSAVEEGWAQVRSLCADCARWLRGQPEALHRALRAARPERSAYMQID
ncbi:MAG: hypothetical protein IRZ14_19270 [Chloroflexi bacterium]|nr:hypothetical protein [Chloroflexota bacterium]